MFTLNPDEREAILRALRARRDGASSQWGTIDNLSVSGQAIFAACVWYLNAKDYLEDGRIKGVLVVLEGVLRANRQHAASVLRRLKALGILTREGEGANVRFAFTPTTLVMGVVNQLDPVPGTSALVAMGGGPIEPVSGVLVEDATARLLALAERRHLVASVAVQIIQDHPDKAGDIGRLLVELSDEVDETADAERDPGH